MIFWSTAIAKILQQLLNSKQMIPVRRKLGGKYGKIISYFNEKNISEATQTKFLLAPEESQKYVKMPPQDV